MLLTESILVLVRLLLAAVFAAAAIAKLADAAGSRGALRGFGVPERLVPPLAVLLPIAELAIAAGLVPGASARVAAGAAVVLLTVFALAITSALIRGRKPDCHCFGRLHSAPAGLGTLLRNAGLTMLAGLLLWQPSSNPSWIELAAAGVVLLVAGQAILSFALLRRYGRALQRIEELETDALERATVEIGSEAPEFWLPLVAGSEVSLADLRRIERPVLLVFIDPGCGPCNALLPDLARWQDEYSDEVTVAVVGHGDLDLLRATAEEHGIARLLVAPDRSVFTSFGSFGTPSAILVSVDGRIASPLVYGAAEIAALVGASAELSDVEVMALA